MKPRSFAPVVLLGFVSFGRALLAADAVKLTPLADRVQVDVGGQHFTDYIYGDGASRPYCYPIFAADGTPLTRDFPMRKDTDDDTDHPWHRSLFFAAVMNGVDVWDEAHGSSLEIGTTVHDTFVETASGDVGVLRLRNRYLGADRRLVATDERTLRFHADADGRYIDCEVTLHALPDKPLVMDDTKEGGMAVRVAQWMTLPHEADAKGPDGKPLKDAKGKTQKKMLPGVGHIVTSAGDRDKAAWGKRAEWCEYHAERGGKIYGIAIFDHPQNIRHPTWWHVRDYGLFSANPFGQHDFEPEFKNNPHKGDYTIPAGGSLTLKYRFYFHLGDEQAARVAAHYADYAAGK